MGATLRAAEGPHDELLDPYSTLQCEHCTRVFGNMVQRQAHDQYVRAVSDNGGVYVVSCGETFC